MTQKRGKKVAREGKKRQKRVIKTTKITHSRRPDGGIQYKTTIPSWIVEKVWQAKVGDRIVWDFEGGRSTVTKEE